MIFLTSTLTVILISVAVFLFVILLLVVMLLYARYKLTPQGDVQLKVNDKEFTVSPGTTVLNTLSANEIFLPSACGGGGTCGMCKCQVLEGGGSILPTETGFFTRKEQQQQWRLGCQVKLREDMTIQIPEEVMGIKKWECEVVSNHNVATFIKEFVVRLPEGEKLNFKSGGYIQIDVPRLEVDFKTDIDVEEEYRDEWDKFKMWDLKMKNPEETYRAYSMANHPAEGNIVMLNIRIATPPWDVSHGRFKNVNPGICSSYIFSRKPGDKVMRIRTLWRVLYQGNQERDGVCGRWCRNGSHAFAHLPPLPYPEDQTQGILLVRSPLQKGDFLRGPVQGHREGFSQLHL